MSAAESNGQQRWLVVALLAAGPWWAGCRTTVQHSPAGVDEATPARAERRSAWWVVSDGQRRGSVVLFEEQSGARRRLHVVRNEHGQDMGYVDELGRIWRRRVHATEAELLGTGPLLVGALRILGREGDTRPQLLNAEGEPDVPAAEATLD